MRKNNLTYRLKIAGMLVCMALFCFSSCSTSRKTRKHKGCDCPTWSMDTTINQGTNDERT